MPVCCPDLNLNDWQEMNDPVATHLENGGFKYHVPDILKRLYLFENPPAWPVFALWDGTGGQPVPGTATPYEMKPDQWVEAAGGFLVFQPDPQLAPINWIHKDGKIINILAVDVAGQQLAMVTDVKV